MSKAIVIIKSMGIGDLCILIGSIQAISKKITKPVTVLAQKNTHAQSILKYDPHVEEVIELNKKGFFNIVKKIKSKKFDQSYIYSDSIRLYLIARVAGIKENFHYKFFSKKGKNFFKTAKEFTDTRNTKIEGAGFDWPVMGIRYTNQKKFYTIEGTLLSDADEKTNEPSYTACRMGTNQSKAYSFIIEGSAIKTWAQFKTVFSKDPAAKNW